MKFISSLNLGEILPIHISGHLTQIGEEVQIAPAISDLILSKRLNQHMVLSKEIK